MQQSIINQSIADNNINHLNMKQPLDPSLGQTDRNGPKQTETDRHWNRINIPDPNGTLTQINNDPSNYR